jgi:hypothetical protein
VQVSGKRIKIEKRSNEGWASPPKHPTQLTTLSVCLSTLCLLWISSHPQLSPIKFSNNQEQKKKFPLTKEGARKQQPLQGSICICVGHILSTCLWHTYMSHPHWSPCNCSFVSELIYSTLTFKVSTLRVQSQDDLPLSSRTHAGNNSDYMLATMELLYSG